MAFQGKLSVGWVGLGAMGFGMATNLVKEGYEVTAFDLYAPSLERFKTAGGTPTKSLRESATGKATYVCMVASIIQLNQLMFEGDEPLLDSLEKGTTFLVSSTVAAADIIEFEQELIRRDRNDIFLVDCPVSGGARRAANGTLSIMAGGSKEALANAEQILRDMSDVDKLFFPGSIGQGSNLKMVHQVLAAIQIATNSEALAFATWLNLDLNAVREAVLQPESKAYSWMFENRSPRTIENKVTPPESALTIILKDTGIITKSARQNRYPVPLCSTAEQIYLSGLLHGFGPEDDATLARLYLPQLKPPAITTNQLSQDSAKQAALGPVLNLMEGIHTVAAAEAIGFAHSLGLDSKMVIKLVNEAAGASWSFRKYASGMFDKLKTIDQSAEANPLSLIRGNLAEAVSQARAINAPLFLGNAALEIMTQVERAVLRGQNQPTILDLVKYYT